VIRSRCSHGPVGPSRTRGFENADAPHGRGYNIYEMAFAHFR